MEKVAGSSTLRLEVLFREAPWLKWLEKLGYGGEGCEYVNSVIRGIISRGAVAEVVRDTRLWWRRLRVGQFCD